MGMAASQARLLSLTARIHDVEHQAQSIQNAKLQLALQEDKVYSEYNDALAATTLTVLAMDGTEKVTLPVTFDNLFGPNRVTVANGDKYALFTADNELIVDDDVYQAYTALKDKGVNDPYLFATYMAMDNPSGWLNGVSASDASDLGDAGFAKKLHEAEESIYKEKGKDNENLKSLHKKLSELVGTEAVSETDEETQTDIYAEDTVADNKKDDYKELLTQYRALLYKTYTTDIIEATSGDNNSSGNDAVEDYGFDKDKYNYYLSIFKQIEQNGGNCVPISIYGEQTSNNTEWLQAMVESGQFVIHTYEEDKGEVKFDATSVGSDSCLKYTETSTIDKRALAKAEAEYEHKMKQIDRKDKQYDLTLSKLETERQALTTEYDSVKKVIQENVQRTFGIFS